MNMVMFTRALAFTDAYNSRYGKGNNDDEDDQLYEVTAGNANLRTGYGGAGQEPLYETIPGEKVTPRQSRCAHRISTAFSPRVARYCLSEHTNP